MRAFRLFRRHQPVVTYSEPTGRFWVDDVARPGDRQRGEDTSVDGASRVGGDYDAGDDLRGANAVFGLIGAPTTDDDRAARRAHDSDGDANNTPMTSAHDVIQALHEQYCRALDDPQASLAGNWAAQGAVPVAGDSPMDVHEDHSGWHEPSTGRASTGERSIEALLSGARDLTDLFGPLGEGVTPGIAGLADAEPVPEILRLFAPAEYHAAASRRPPALPPALARREHHALGIDSPMSPMPAPDSSTHGDAP